MDHNDGGNQNTTHNISSNHANNEIQDSCSCD